MDFLGIKETELKKVLRKRKASDINIESEEEECPDNKTPSRKIIRAEYDKITIDKTSIIYTKKIVKNYKCVNTKGIIDRKTSIVYPYGYNPSYNTNI